MYQINALDIVVAGVVLYALWRGWRSGILVQLSGLIGIILGAWVAFKFTDVVSIYLKAEEFSQGIFVLVLVAVLVAVIFLARFITRILDMGGLSLPLKLSGALFSVIKALVTVSLLLSAFEFLNSGNRFTDSAYLKKGYAYEKLSEISTFVFPYLSQAKDLAEEFSRTHESSTEVPNL